MVSRNQIEIAEDELQLFRRIEDGTATSEEVTEFCEWMIDSMCSDLACGAGLCAVYPWDTIAAAETATGRNLEAEAMRQLV